MKLLIQDARRPLGRCELLVVLALEGEGADLPAGVEISARARKDFKGEFREGRLTDALSGPAARVFLLGLGKKELFSAERLRRAAGLAVRTAENQRQSSAVVWTNAHVLKEGESPLQVGQALAEGLRMGSYACTRFKSKAEALRLQRVVLVGSGSGFRAGARRGEILASANLFARDLQNTPSNLMRPRELLGAARAVARRSRRIRLRTFDARAMQRLGMGALLSVAKGSAEPPYLLHLAYRPKGQPRARIALVGKGLTFDAGGISLKPAAKMEEMKFDMSGAAAVLGVFHALAELDVPCEVHGLAACAENLPDGRANKPGDLVRAMNGLTIEVLNTDAEGRLVLADALVYACRMIRPDTIIDLATLTGAVVTALGHELTGLMGNSERLARDLVRAGEECGEACWRLPLLDVHRDQMKSKLADLKNINAGEGNGASAGAGFLASFVENGVDWAHLDIAGTAWGGIDRDYVGGPNGSGVGARLLLQYLENCR
jgi:leucyl aminopeptidase